MEKREKLIPRKIWLLWYQGRLEAPFLVKGCIDSWVKENPDWEVIVLDKHNIGRYISLDLQHDKLVNLSLTTQSDLIRLNLLSEYGGIWADATTFCMRPLDDWIYDSTASGFFAFNNPGPDRMLSTWFLACEKECPIIIKWRELFTSFFMENSFDIDGGRQKRQIQALSESLNQSIKTTKHWFSPLVTKVLKIYPYFICHYAFERLIFSNRECQEIWSKTKKVSADEPHRIQRVGLFSSVNKVIKTEIDKKSTPIYKLTWKYDHSEYSSSSVLYYLLEGRNRT